MSEINFQFFGKYLLTKFDTCFTANVVPTFKKSNRVAMTSEVLMPLNLFARNGAISKPRVKPMKVTPENAGSLVAIGATGNNGVAGNIGCVAR